MEISLSVVINTSRRGLMSGRNVKNRISPQYLLRKALWGVGENLYVLRDEG